MKNKKTIQKQIFFYIMSTIALVYILNIIFNTFFIENIYIQKKETEIKNIYYALEDKDLSDEELKQIHKECFIKNIKLFTTDESYIPKYYSFEKTEFSDEEDFIEHMKYIDKPGPKDNSKKEKILETNDKFFIVKLEEQENSLKMLELRTTKENPNNIIIRISIDNIKDSIMLYQEISYIFLIIGFIVSFIISFLISKKISKPIASLTNISKKMIDLNFETKYKENANNEIDILGKNFNNLSEKLNNTLIDLKEANTQLEKDLRIFENIDSKRKEFISNVSHELKTPISLIEGYAEALKEDISDNPEDNEEYCNIIIDESIKMNKLVRQLIELIQAEEVAPNITEFNLLEMTKNIIGLYNKDNLDIKINTTGNLQINSDEFKLERAIINYITNAINHVDESKEIKIEIIQSEEIITFSIFNKGNNIQEEDIEAIWERFYKVDKARTREYGGSGIGLSIVKENIKSLKGKVGVKNLEKGVLFYFTIPVNYPL